MNYLISIKVLIGTCMPMLLLISINVTGHSGGLDSSGCHGGSRPYHCHRAASEMVGNRLHCDLGSKSEDCNNTPSGTLIINPSQESDTAIEKSTIDQYRAKIDLPQLKSNRLLVKRIQLRLQFMRLYEGPIDGYFGNQTALAFDTFATFNGLPTGQYTDKHFEILGVIK
jgi:hypothetical protein